MILVGQYDSPFVRRVAITLNLYGMHFERKVLSVFTDFEAMLAINPLGRVPVLELENGERLFDSRMILDYLDGLVDTERKLMPCKLPDRLRVLG
ncbi:MAG: glutathione S-transferase family protein, partial [Gammaproteobacteria bacterium]|nr:glutathione S-transferase family protein [Gammaproteobacteria bacterium]